MEDIRDFYGRDRAAGREEEMVFAIVRVLGGYKHLRAGDVVLGVDHLQHFRGFFVKRLLWRDQGGKCLHIICWKELQNGEMPQKERCEVIPVKLV